MIKNECVDLTIEDMSDEGLGIGHADGMAVFVKDAIVGDSVKAKITKAKKTYAYARCEEIVCPGSDRVEPVCPSARQCGGCQIQEMNYEAQLRLKEKKVRNHLQRIGGFDPDTLRIHPVIGMEHPWNYRSKAQYPIGEDRDGKLIAGFYAGRTHSIIDNHRCEIGAPQNEAILETVLRYMKKCHVSAYNETTGDGVIRHVMIRNGAATGQFMVVIVANADRLPMERVLVDMLLDTELKFAAVTPRIVSIVLNTNKAQTNVILGKTTRVLFGEDAIEEKIGDMTYRISSQSFFQVNPLQTEKLYETALEYAGLTGCESVWDLYCGCGTISLFLAGRAKHVTGVEVIPDAIRNAEQNAQLNNISNCTFLVGKAEDILPQMKKEADVVVVDPPRKGLDPIVIDVIAEAAPERIVYVSCDSATMARDLRMLADRGYEIAEVQPVDMFPQTVKVETVCFLCRTEKKTE